MRAWRAILLNGLRAWLRALRMTPDGRRARRGATSSPTRAGCRRARAGRRSAQPRRPLRSSLEIVRRQRRPPCSPAPRPAWPPRRPHAGDGPDRHDLGPRCRAARASAGDGRDARARSVQAAAGRGRTGSCVALRRRRATFELATTARRSCRRAAGCSPAATGSRSHAPRRVLAELRATDVALGDGDDSAGGDQPARFVPSGRWSTAGPGDDDVDASTAGTAARRRGRRHARA